MCEADFDREVLIFKAFQRKTTQTLYGKESEEAHTDTQNFQLLKKLGYRKSTNLLHTMQVVHQKSWIALPVFLFG